MQNKIIYYHFTKPNLKKSVLIKVKDTNIKNRTYYFLSDIIDVENYDPNNIKIYEKLYKNILNYYIECEVIKNSK